MDNLVKEIEMFLKKNVWNMFKEYMNEIYWGYSLEDYDGFYDLIKDFILYYIYS